MGNERRLVMRPHVGFFVLVSSFTLTAMVGVQSATVYKCVDSEGAIVFSDQPCNGGNKVEILPKFETQADEQKEERLEKSRQYNEAVAIRIEVRKLRREKSRLEEKRRVLIGKRDDEVSKLSKILQEVSSKDLHARAYWNNQLVGARSLYNRMIHSLESKIFQKQAELQQLNKKQETAQSRPASRVLDRASWGKCRLYIEG